MHQISSNFALSSVTWLLTYLTDKNYSTTGTLSQKTFKYRDTLKYIMKTLQVFGTVLFVIW
jgi:hypothetical protein